MSDPFIGEIRIVGFNFAPRGWTMCDGRLLSTSQNSALFSLPGTTYGGDGVTTFALPNLQSRVPVHAGQGSGLSSYSLGDAAGVETVTLTVNETPAHNHPVRVAGTATSSKPANAVPAPAASPAASTYATASDGTLTNSQMLANAGGNQPHTNIQPYLVLNFCIALEGIFPSRN